MVHTFALFAGFKGLIGVLLKDVVPFHVFDDFCLEGRCRTEGHGFNLSNLAHQGHLAVWFK